MGTSRPPGFDSVDLRPLLLWGFNVPPEHLDVLPRLVASGARERGFQIVVPGREGVRCGPACPGTFLPLGRDDMRGRAVASSEPGCPDRSALLTAARREVFCAACAGRYAAAVVDFERHPLSGDRKTRFIECVRQLHTAGIDITVFVFGSRRHRRQYRNWMNTLKGLVFYGPDGATDFFRLIAREVAPVPV